MANTNLVQHSTGDTIFLDLGTDISSATSLELILTSYKSSIYRVPTVGAGDVESPDGSQKFLAGEYLEYLTVDGDTLVEGTLEVQGNITLSGNERLSVVASFTVLKSLPQNPA